MLYLHFGHQCPYAGIETAAREAAKILNLPFKGVNVQQNPELARQYQMVTSGLIIVDDLRISFPGAEQVAEVIRTRAPLPGDQEYQQLPEEDPDYVKVISSQKVEELQHICVPGELAPYWCQKKEWLKNLDLPCIAMVGYKDGQPVAIAETLPRELIPYPVPEYDGLFITCLFGHYDTKVDYRRGMLEMAMPLLKNLNYTRIAIVAGRGTPFPNGPAELLAQAGFQEAGEFAPVMLRHRWAEPVFMERTI